MIDVAARLTIEGYVQEARRAAGPTGKPEYDAAATDDARGDRFAGIDELVAMNRATFEPGPLGDALWDLALAFINERMRAL